MVVEQKQFIKAINKFSELEDARDQLWDMAKNLLDKGFEIEAYILILATWNFAGFRFAMKNFDIDKFKIILKKIDPIFEKYKHNKLMNIDLSDEETVKNIKNIYYELKNIVKQTGATKLMALKNPKLFVMWDTAIRRKYKIDNQADPDDYVLFLKKMKDEFKNVGWLNSRKPFAKAIDEYNYVITQK